MVRHLQTEAVLMNEDGTVHEHAPEWTEGEVLALKLVVLVINFLITYIGILPRTVSCCKNSSNFLAILNCFSAGIFLGMAFVHMAPEATDIYRDWAYEQGYDHPFPLPFVGLAVGYIIVLAVDRVLAFNFHNVTHGHDELELVAHGAHDCEGKDIKEGGVTKDASEATPSKKSEDARDGDINEFSVGPSAKVTPAKSTAAPNEEKNIINPPIIEGEPADNPTAVKESKDTESKKEEPVEDKPTLSKVTAVILIFAIGFHAIFEGIALGILSDYSTVFQLALGICIHKFGEALALGTAFTKSGFSTCGNMVLLSIFGALTPVGMVVGIVLNTNSNPILDTIVVSLSAGSFIYVSCTEIIVHEFKNQKYIWWKLFFLILGAAGISLLWLLGHDHCHGVCPTDELENSTARV